MCFARYFAENSAKHTDAVWDLPIPHYSVGDLSIPFAHLLHLGD